MIGARAIAEFLKAEGVEYLFCFPGNPLIDTAAQVGIRPIMARTERTAIGMADGYTRVHSGRKIGVCAFQNGPGIENAFGGVAQAFSDSTPILILPRGEPQHRHGQHPNFDAVTNFHHVTKWSERINQVGRIPELMTRAFTYLRMGRSGPVLLEVPADVLTAEFDGTATHTPVRPVRSMADPADVTTAVEAILGAKKPMIQAGLGSLYSQASAELREFAELLEIPVMTTLPGKSAFPEDHPLSLGSGGKTGTLAAGKYLKECDCLIAVGAGLAISSFAAPIGPGKTIIQITNHEFDFNKAYAVTHPLIGDARLVLSQMIKECRRKLSGQERHSDVPGEVRRLKEQWLAQWMPKLTSNETPINPYRVIWELQQVLDLEKTIATHDAGSPRDQMVPFWSALLPNSYVGWGKSTHLGYSLALAMGAKLARPDKDVLHLMGDGAFGMIGMDVETAVRNKIGTLTVLINNSALGGYAAEMPVAAERYGTPYMRGDYAQVARGLGAYTERVTEPEGLAPAIARAVAETRRNQPALLEIITGEDNTFSVYW